MKLSSFKYSFSEELIAQYPLKNRDESRLMIVHKSTGKIEHKFFKDLSDYFIEGDTLVLNDTKVFPSILYGSKEKTGAKIEVFLLRELNQELCLWDTLVEPARKIRVGNKLFFGEGDLIAEVLDNTTSRGRTIKFLFDGTQEDFYKKIDKLGIVPLPNNIKRKVEKEDKERYQTIYAKKEGAVAAPAAGMHFTKYLLKKLEVKGVNICFITLHIGLGMLNTVDVEDLTKYKVNSV
ncbi:MAG: S-adenosylmethionine:tRNA ribosyltransferase-isomerase, partial [Cytophagales bacterium]